MRINTLWAGGIAALVAAGCAGPQPEEPSFQERPPRQVVVVVDTDAARTTPGLSWRLGDSDGLGAAHRGRRDAEAKRCGAVGEESKRPESLTSLYRPRTPSVEVPFGFDEREPDPDEINRLIDIARGTEGLRSVHVTGHTDSVGADAYNIALAGERAAVVAKALSDALGEQVEVTHAGHGPCPVVSTNDTPEGRAANRRVEVHFLED